MSLQTAPELRMQAVRFPVPLRRAPTAMVALFDAVMPDHPAIERRRMFGYPAAFAYGYLFAGLHQGELILRLSPDDRMEVLHRGLAVPWKPAPNRTMREYVCLAAEVLNKPRTVRRWIDRSVAYCGRLPQKRPPLGPANSLAASPTKARKTQP